MCGFCFLSLNDKDEQSNKIHDCILMFITFFLSLLIPGKGLRDLFKSRIIKHNLKLVIANQGV